jgi:hypothetical protein
MNLFARTLKLSFGLTLADVRLLTGHIQICQYKILIPIHTGSKKKKQKQKKHASNEKL